jgi:hypothetical protein
MLRLLPSYSGSQQIPQRNCDCRPMLSVFLPFHTDRFRLSLLLWYLLFPWLIRVTLEPVRD